MPKVKLLEQFLQEDLNEGLFDVVTKSKAFVKNPIAATKISNNGKKLAQAQVDSASTELDFEKRKLASSKAAKQKIEALKKKGDNDGAQKVKDEFTDNKDALKAAHDQKSDALTDKVGSIKDRIDDLAKKNSSLQDLASLVKTAARVKKNEVLFKGADDEEKKQLKLQMKDDMEKIQGLQKGFGDYEGADEPEDKGEKTKDKKDSDVTVDTGDDKTSSSTSTTPPPPPPAAPKSDKPTDKPLTTSQAPKDETPDEAVARTRQDVRDQQRIIADHKGRIKDAEDKIADLKAGKYDKKKVADPQAEITKLQNSIQAEKDAMTIAQSELEDLVKASQEAEAKVPKDEPTAEPKAAEPKAEPKAAEPKAEPKAAEPKAEPKAAEPKAAEPKAEPKAAEPKAEDPMVALDAEIEKNIEDRGKITRQIKDLEKELEWKSGDEEKAVKDKIESLKAERQKIDDEGENLSKRKRELEGDPWKGSAKESFTTLKSFKDFVNEKKFS